MAELKIGTHFWAVERIGNYPLSGHPLDLTIIGETKTLWRVKRTDYSVEEVHPFTIKKDMSDWGVVSAEDAQKIIWMRENSRKVRDAFNCLPISSCEQQIANYQTVKDIAKVLGVK